MPDSVLHKGRGATLNAASTRFDDPFRQADPDWRDAADTVDGPLPPPRTTVALEAPRTVITRNASPDVPFDRSLNAYRGCEHGCVYCFARPSHAYHNLSPGLDFETKLYAKTNVAALLRAELAKRGYEPAPLAMGTNTDPYQPIEDRFGTTRAVLEVLLEHRHPVSIVTKSDRVLRDLDRLVPLAEQGLVHVGLSVTTLDAALARRMEPRAPTPARRLAAIRGLVAAGVPTALLAAPIIPAINDHEIEALAEAAASAGACALYMIPVRLPAEVAPLFRDWLRQHYPERAAHVMSLINQIRDGRDNDPRFGSRMRGSGPFADLIHARAAAARRRYGVDGRLPPLDCSRFALPPGPQLALF